MGIFPMMMTKVSSAVDAAPTTMNSVAVVPSEDVPNTINGITEEDDSPDVIPLQVSGTIDTEMSTVTANEMMSWGLANLWDEGKEGGYAVRHGRQPNDIPREAEPGTDTNFFEKAYPCLFPYGEGGIERKQPVLVDFGDHIRWLLRYNDRQFRKHETFPFVLGSAQVKMRCQTFQCDARVLSTITLESMQRAQEEEARNLPVSDPAIRLLHQHLYSMAGRVIGTDQSRYQLRSQIWATFSREKEST
ncbi:hypothetical protein EDD15DRAFT_2196724 [Pisolithus albus]|nr:hypothetical protein EDD15DRAFT_2196724 [Pisolithus albus]